MVVAIPMTLPITLLPAKFSLGAEEHFDEGSRLLVGLSTPLLAPRLFKTSSLQMAYM